MRHVSQNETIPDDDVTYEMVEAAMLAMWPDAVDIQFPRGVFANPYQFVRAGIQAALAERLRQCAKPVSERENV